MTATIFDEEIEQLNDAGFTEVWIDEPGIVIVTRSIVLVDTDPQVERITSFMRRHDYVLGETFPSDEAPEFIAGKVICQVWEVTR